MFRVKNRDKQPQFFDKHLSKTRKIQFRILMRSDALWYSDHSSSGTAGSLVMIGTNLEQFLSQSLVANYIFITRNYNT